MPKGDERALPPGVHAERRKLVDRRRLAHVGVERILGLVEEEDGVVRLRAVGEGERPIELTMPVPVAMALLNDLQRLAREGNWFAVE